MIWRGLAIGAVATVFIAGLAVADAEGPQGPRMAYLMLDRSKSRVELRTAGPAGAAQRVLLGGGKAGAAPRPRFGWAPSWSPDGRLLAFSGSKEGRSQIYLARVPGGQVRVVPRTRGGFAPVFASDGRSIAFARGRFRSRIVLPKNGRPPRIFSFDSVTTWTVRLDGTAARRLTPWRNGLEVIPSSFSPDGLLLGASEWDERGLQDSAITLATAGSRFAKRRVIARDATRPSFSPDGSRIALISYVDTEPRRGRSGFYRGRVTVMNADGSGAKRLSRTTFQEQSPPSWDPSGERLAYTEHTSVVEVNADGSCRRKVLRGTSTRLYHGPAWRPGPGREAGRIAC